MDPDIVALRKAKRISWLGHGPSRWRAQGCARSTRRYRQGRRPLGRPKIRWCDQVVEDVNLQREGLWIWRKTGCRRGRGPQTRQRIGLRFVTPRQ
ncbi:hypothetical protein J6590_073932 [Homalodisca vitripennis]|nr:hypothetical protein J6590_073932 [Homalodisca vitripennis]